MCGIIALVSRPSGREVPAARQILDLLDQAVAAPDLGASTRSLRSVDDLLKGVPGVRALVDQRELTMAMADRLSRLEQRSIDAEAELERTDSTTDLEVASARLIEFRDAVWAVRQDRLGTASAVFDLAGRDAGPAAIAGYLMIQQSFAVLDRLEVRGRDSAGLHVFVWNHHLDHNDPAVATALRERATDPLFQNGSVRWLDNGVLSFVYKAAAEIGELGDNTRAMRSVVVGDSLLRRALSTNDARCSVIGHTRWASVGIISEPNAHPVNSEVADPDGSRDYVVAALNGDVDNHADLRVEYGLRFANQITTDAKVIPALVGHHLDAGCDDVEAFRRTVSSFEGSVAIAAAGASRPDRILLSLRGSGQGLFVGVADDLLIAASEPYGLVAETDSYLRLDGETTTSPGESRGQIVVLDGARAGEIDGIRRLAYDGTDLPISTDEFVRAEVTTRDIDRGDFPHFLLKEITEAPTSLRKTLRGKIVEANGSLSVRVGARTLPPAVVDALMSGRITKVRVIGQGTAAIAGQSCARILDELAGGALDVDPVVATEFSGFGLQLDMSDTLVIAVSQSGTTTDTNRTVDLARSRGALVLAIVNRRGSDLCDKADGVLFTSDGRDVEMSVASTKAFYAQVAAGVLLACAITELLGLGSAARRHELLAALRRLPDAMTEVVAQRSVIGDIARRFAPSRRYWAVVGNGPNAVAAQEVRIKLSELCYKSIACDVTEDKKHIDLSCEPLILVCAAGLVGSNADDVAKEIAIFRAHKATPIVVGSESSRFDGASALVKVPEIDPSLDFVLSAVVGHLFGYEAARAIDELARSLRETREVVEHAVMTIDDGERIVAALRTRLRGPAADFFDTLRVGSYDGHLEASTAVRLASLLRIVTMDNSIEAHQAETGKVGSPAALVDDLTLALTRAIEELTRPIDAIKHQAKTVTVGISRSDEGVLDRSLVQAVLATGTGRDVLSYRTLKVLADLDAAVEEVVGFTRYRIEGDGSDETIAVVDRGGISRDLPSRVDRNPVLVGTKRRVAHEREVLVARGRTDGRTVVFVPEVKAGSTVGILLLHVRFYEYRPAAVMRAVLQGYDRRYERLVDWVSETEGEMNDELLSTVPVADLLVLPISDVADRWRRK